MFMRCCGSRSTAGCGSGVLSSSQDLAAGLAVVVAKRFVQFQQTSEVNRGINKNQREVATKWITKSTRDYAMETTRSLSANPAKASMQTDLTAKKKFMQDVADNTDKVFDTELSRITDYKQRRWRKSVDFFKRHGVVFTLMYLGTYLGCLLLLYLSFASGLVNKEYVYGMLALVLTGFMDKDDFYRKIEAWDTYVNFGFAFVVNECLEVLRFPFMVFTFYTFRPLLIGFGRKTRKSIFRRNAAEH